MAHYDVAAYIWPAYHYEPRMEHIWPEKDGEWYVIRRGTPRFPGHNMPRVPVLGYQDEADPAVMREHVAMGLDHGVNVFIMDWYWYDNAPCFERQLNEGLIPALEGTDAKFYLMWANHDATTLWDMHAENQDLLWGGQVDRGTLEPMFERIIDRYLTLDSYYRIDDKPVFSIYHYGNLIAGLGGFAQTQDAFAWMRGRCTQRGLPGLNLQTISWREGGRVEGGASLDGAGEPGTADAPEFDGATSYQFVHHAGNKGDYAAWAARGIAQWEQFEQTYGIYYPHVSVGWDNTQRNQSIWTAVTGCTPDAFEDALRKAKAYLDARPNQRPLVTINSWNEWSEGSYLLPDERWGYGYLEAVRNVFGSAGH